MIIIRLSKKGSKNKPFYRVVATDKQKKVSGKFLEILGYFNPIKKEFRIDNALLEKWVSKGAKLSARIKKLISESKI